MAALTDRCATQAAVGGVCLASPFFVVNLDLFTLGVLFEDFNVFLMDYTTKVWIAVVKVHRGRRLRELPQSENWGTPWIVHQPIRTNTERQKL